MNAGDACFIFYGMNTTFWCGWHSWVPCRHVSAKAGCLRGLAVLQPPCLDRICHGISNEKMKKRRLKALGSVWAGEATHNRLVTEGSLQRAPSRALCCDPCCSCVQLAKPAASKPWADAVKMLRGGISCRRD